MAGATTTAPMNPGFGGSTFARGAGARGLFGVIIALAGLGLAWGIEHASRPADTERVVPPNTHPITVPAKAAGAQLVRTGAYRSARFESTFPATWTVTFDNAPLTPSSSDQTQWVGAIASGEVVVTATPIDPADTNLHGLRIDAGDGVRGEWGNGAVTAVVPATASKP